MQKSQSQYKQVLKEDTNRYDAFISYSHAADGKLAPALQKALQNIAKPLFKRKALSVFRDQTDLAATPHLWKNIEEALSQSRFLILLASPKSAGSKWVRREIDFWLENKSIESILIALTDGIIEWDEDRSDFDWSKTNALPPNLRNQFEMEPLFINLRDAYTSDDLSLENPEFKNKAAALASAIHGLALSDLIGEDIRILKRTIRIRNSVIALLTALFFGMLWFAWQTNIKTKETQQQKEQAVKQRNIANMRGESLRRQLIISDSLGREEKRQKNRAEEALIEAYQNQISIHNRDRDQLLNTIALAIQAQRPQDTVKYYRKAVRLQQEIDSLRGEILLYRQNKN